MLRYKVVVCFVLVFMVVVACQSSPPPFECKDALGCVTIKPGEPVKLGVLEWAEPDGEEQTNSINLALDKWENKFLGHPIVTLLEDEKCSAEGGSNAALKVVADPQVVAILGTSCSSSATTASKIMSENNLVMVSGSNSSPDLTSVNGQQGKDWHVGYFRTAQNDVLLGKAAATFVFQKLAIKQVATIDDGTDYPKGLVEAFGVSFKELGGEVLLSNSVNIDDTNFEPVLKSVELSGAKLLFFVLNQPQANNFILQARGMDSLKEVVLLSSDILFFQPLVETLGEKGLNLHVVGNAEIKSPATDALAAAYKAKYGKSYATASYLSAYDATNLLLEKLKAITVQDTDGTLHVGRQALRDALYATTNFEGVTGKLSCDKFGDCAAAKFDVMRLDDPSKGLDGLKANVIYTYDSQQK